MSDDVGWIGSANPWPIFQPAADSMHLPGLPEGSVRNELNKRPGSVHTSGDTSAPYNQVSAFRISSPRSIHVLLVLPERSMINSLLLLGSAASGAASRIPARIIRCLFESAV